MHSLKLYPLLLRAQLRSQMQYRVSFLFQLFGTGLISLFEFGSLALVFQRFGSIRGWSIGEVGLLYGMVETAFGIMDMVFSGFDPAYFGQQVRKGTFDQLLLRPINITVQVLGSDFALRRIGKIVVGIGIFAVAVRLTEIAWTPAKIALVITAIFAMILFFGGLFIAGAAITFWTVESIEVLNILTYGGSYVISHPMHIYQDWLRKFFTFIVPAIFLNYYPALYILERPDPFGMPAFAPLLSPVVGLGVFGLSLAFWRFGIRHYQSTGT